MVLLLMQLEEHASDLTKFRHGSCVTPGLCYSRSAPAAVLTHIQSLVFISKLTLRYAARLCTDVRAALLKSAAKHTAIT
jgi:hypothetical protein